MGCIILLPFSDKINGYCFLVVTVFAGDLHILLKAMGTGVVVG